MSGRRIVGRGQSALEDRAGLTPKECPSKRFGMYYIHPAGGEISVAGGTLSDCFPTTGSPLVLDLDGDGVEAGAVEFFDHESDGFMEATRWVGEDDGMLVWDRNGDGVINDGSELFGNNTVLANGKNAEHGFAALSELDSNGDGIVNAVDENFSDLRVLRWTDANENGTKICFLM